MVSSNIHSMASCSMIFLTRDTAVGNFGGLDMTVLGKLHTVISTLLFHRLGVLRFRIWHTQVNLLSRVLEKLTVRQLIKKFMAVYKPRRYTTITIIFHRCQYPQPDEFNTRCSRCFFKTSLNVSLNLHLRGFYPSGFPKKILFHFCFPRHLSYTSTT